MLKKSSNQPFTLHEPAGEDSLPEINIESLYEHEPVRHEVHKDAFFNQKRFSQVNVGVN